MCYTNVSVEDFNLALFENDSNSDAMKAYVNFLAEHKKTYADRKSQAHRYKIFKANYEKVNKHNLYAQDLPFTMSLNYFADMSDAEYQHLHRLRVPAHLQHSAKDYDELLQVRGHGQGVDRFDGRRFE